MKAINLTQREVKDIDNITLLLRVIKPQPIKHTMFDYYEWFARGHIQATWKLDGTGFVGKCPYAVGDRLWVRETWCFECHDVSESPVTKEDICYRTQISDDSCGVWLPSQQMPQWASRYTLEVTSVEAKRLEGVTEEEAMAVGLQDWYGVHTHGEPYTNKIRLANYWDSENHEYRWETNPWCWYIGVKKI